MSYCRIRTTTAAAEARGKQHFCFCFCFFVCMQTVKISKLYFVLNCTNLQLCTWIYYAIVLVTWFLVSMWPFGEVTFALRHQGEAPGDPGPGPQEEVRIENQRMNE